MAKIEYLTSQELTAKLPGAGYKPILRASATCIIILQDLRKRILRISLPSVAAITSWKGVPWVEGFAIKLTPD